MEAQVHLLAYLLPTNQFPSTGWWGCAEREEFFDLIFDMCSIFTLDYFVFIFLFSKKKNSEDQKQKFIPKLATGEWIG